jgi:hypothetical protein
MYHLVKAIWANGMAMEVTVWAQGQATAIERFKEVMESRGVDFSGAPFPERFEISYPIPDGRHTQKRQTALMSFSDEYNVFVHMTDREGVHSVLGEEISDERYTEVVDLMMIDDDGMITKTEGDLVHDAFAKI